MLERRWSNTRMLIKESGRHCNLSITIISKLCFLKNRFKEEKKSFRHWAKERLGERRQWDNAVCNYIFVFNLTHVTSSFDRPVDRLPSFFSSIRLNLFRFVQKKKNSMRFRIKATLVNWNSSRLSPEIENYSFVSFKQTTCSQPFELWKIPLNFQRKNLLLFVCFLLTFEHAVYCLCCCCWWQTYHFILLIRQIHKIIFFECFFSAFGVSMCFFSSCLSWGGNFLVFVRLEWKCVLFKVDSMFLASVLSLHINPIMISNLNRLADRLTDRHWSLFATQNSLKNKAKEIERKRKDFRSRKSALSCAQETMPTFIRLSY